MKRVSRTPVPVAAVAVLLSLFFIAFRPSAVAAAGTDAAAPERPLRVVASVPNLGALIAAVGGDRVEVAVVLDPDADPYRFDPGPGALEAVRNAELYVRNGFGLESTWGLSLLKEAANRRILPSSRGYLDASTAVTPLDIPGTVTGDPTPMRPAGGNPDYLLDPLSALAVVELIRSKLGELRPESGAYFDSRADAFGERVKTSLVGPELASRYRADALAVLFSRGQLPGFLASQGESALLGGWLGRMAPFRGTKVVADRCTWPYFAQRFGIAVRSYLEVEAGQLASPGHIERLLTRVRSEDVRFLLASPYSQPELLRTLSTAAGLHVLPMISQAGARGTPRDYIAMIDYNVSCLTGAFSAALTP